VIATGSTSVAISATARIDTTTATVAFSKDTYELTDTGMVTMIDPDANTNSVLIESAQVAVYSTTDPAGMSLTVQETDLNTGIFMGSFTFSSSVTAGSMLFASTGDTITASYTDNTANTGDIPGWTPGIVTRLFITDTATIGAAAIGTPITSTTPALQDQSGNAITTASRGTMVLLASDMSNTGTTDQAMLYIVQVKDSAGSVVSLSFISGTVPAGATYTFGIPWTPTMSGSFTVEVFAWASWTDPSPLSAEVGTSTVSVT
jgi:hypothetical protein